MEVAITPNWLIKSEYLFVQFDGERFPGFDEDNGDRFEFSADDLDIHVVRLGLNYKFGWGHQEVAAPEAAPPLK